MVALLIVPLVAMGVIPLVGAMRRAEELASAPAISVSRRSRRSPLKTLVAAA